MATSATKETNDYECDCGIVLVNNPGGIQTHLRSMTHAQRLRQKNKSKQFTNIAQMFVFQRQKSRNMASKSASMIHSKALSFKKMCDKTAPNYTSVIDKTCLLDDQPNSTNNVPIYKINAAKKHSISNQTPFKSPPRKRAKMDK